VKLGQWEHALGAIHTAIELADAAEDNEKKLRYEAMLKNTREQFRDSRKAKLQGMSLEYGRFR
jgi:hypothetical protein